MTNSKLLCSTRLLLGSLALCLALEAQPAGYLYTPIAVSDSSLTLPDLPPVLNGLGKTAFRAVLNGEIVILVGDGTSAPSTVAGSLGTFAQLAGPGAINDAGHVTFAAQLDLGPWGIFRSDGVTTETIDVGAFTGGFPDINRFNEVAYSDFPSTRILRQSAGTITVIADTLGVFNAFNPSPRINDNGVVTFFAASDSGEQAILKGNGVPDAGGALVTTVARSGDGTFSSFGFRPDINNDGTVAFPGTLVGGAEGIFKSDAGVLSTIASTAEGIFSDFRGTAINDSGTVAFIGTLVDGRRGVFTGPDSTADRVIAAGDALLGSQVAEVFFFSGLNNAGQLAVLVVLIDGRKAVVRADRDTATPPGSDVVVQPVDPITNTSPATITFDEVNQSGTTTVTTSTTGAPPPNGLKLGSPPTYYEISTTASFAGPVTICINYADVSFGNENTLKLMHLEDTNADGVPDTWVDRTISLDTTHDLICATVTSFSPFAVFERAFAFIGFMRPVNNAPTVNSVRAGSAVPIKFSLDGSHGLQIFAAGQPSSWQVECGAESVVAAPEEAGTAGHSQLQYDAAMDLYTYIWKTDADWAGTCRRFELGLNDSSTHAAFFRFTGK